MEVLIPFVVITDTFIWSDKVIIHRLVVLVALGCHLVPDDTCIIVLAAKVWLLLLDVDNLDVLLLEVGLDALQLQLADAGEGLGVSVLHHNLEIEVFHADASGYPQEFDSDDLVELHVQDGLLDEDHRGTKEEEVPLEVADVAPDS